MRASREFQQLFTSRGNLVADTYCVESSWRTGNCPSESSGRWQRTRRTRRLSALRLPVSGYAGLALLVSLSRGKSTTACKPLLEDHDRRSRPARGQRSASTPARAPLKFIARFSTTFPSRGSHTSGKTRIPELLPTKVLRRPDGPESHRTLLADDDRSRRPGARSDVRQRHDRLRRRAVGPTLDHDRHVASRRLHRPPAAADREVRLLQPPEREGRDLAEVLKYRTVPHITLKSIAQNTNLDPIFAKHQPILDRQLEAANGALCQVSDSTRTRLLAKLVEKQKRREDARYATPTADAGTSRSRGKGGSTGRCRSTLTRTGPTIYEGP